MLVDRMNALWLILGFLAGAGIVVAALRQRLRALTQEAARAVELERELVRAHADLEPRHGTQGEGWQTNIGAPELGVHARGRGPGDSFSLPYFTVDNLPAALERVTALEGTVVHPGARWAICRDSEGSPFGLALATDVA